MSRSEPVLHFHDWPETTFLAWVAGYFDGEGCVHLRAGNLGVEITISNTDANTLRSIQARFGFGVVRVLREPTERHKRQFVWKVTKLCDVRAFLTRVRGYLTTKAPKADLALRRICESVERQNVLEAQDEQVADLRRAGLTQAAIAARLGTSMANVSRILLRGREERSLL